MHDVRAALRGAPLMSWGNFAHDYAGSGAANQHARPPGGVLCAWLVAKHVVKSNQGGTHVRAAGMLSSRRRRHTQRKCAETLPLQVPGSMRCCVTHKANLPAQAELCPQ